ncbi:MAG: radical SAM protein, partial [Treponema sp.]|nr:radical SAM protein [Treponema sp.]
MKEEFFVPPAKKARPFSVMVKPVGSLCNLRCSYCYYIDTVYEENAGTSVKTAGSAVKTAGAVMTKEILELFIRQYIEASSGPVVSFTWHGGEPALAGLDFYRLALDLQKQYLPKGWSCWNNLQTNGVLLDEQWCSFLAKEHFDVGLSIDGVRRIHDLYRKDSGGSGTWQSAAAAVKRLQSYGVQPDLLCTVTSDTAAEPLAVYRALRDLGTGWIQFIPIIRTNAGQITPDSVSGQAYGKFLCDIFDEWALHDMGRTDIQFFAETLQIWSGGEAGLCFLAPVCGRAL